MDNNERKVIYELKSVLNLISRYVDNNISKEFSGQITGMQGLVIGFIGYYNNQGKVVFQKDIEEEFMIRGSTVSKMLDLMIEKEIVEKVNVDYDARLKKIILTNSGEKIKKQMIKSMNQLEKKSQEGLTNEQLNNFFEVMDKIKENLK